jgi:hypothetical protein
MNEVLSGLPERREGQLVALRFQPMWAFIQSVRELGHSVCQAAFADPLVAQRARLIIQEALENAVKYSSPDGYSELEVIIGTEDDSVEITVVSTPRPEHLANLRDELRWICELSPEEAYLEAFRRAAQNPDCSARLGLARMRFEGGMRISMVEDHGQLRLTARGAV